jgi:hypothetical protein
MGTWIVNDRIGWQEGIGIRVEIKYNKCNCICDKFFLFVMLHRREGFFFRRILLN